MKSLRSIPFYRQTLVFIVIIAAIVFGFFKLQSLTHNNATLIRDNQIQTAAVKQLTIDDHKQEVTDQYNSCVSGNAVRANIRNYLESFIPVNERNTAKGKAFIAGEQKAFPENNCAKLSGKN